MHKTKFNNHGGARKGAGRKKGTGLTSEIQKHCYNFMVELLKDEAIKNKAIKQLSFFEEPEIEEDYLYIIRNNNLCKIGYSSNWKKRYKAYKTHLGFVDIIYLTKTKNSFYLEDKLHEMFKEKRVTGEWFSLSNEDLLKCVSFCSQNIS